MKTLLLSCCLLISLHLSAQETMAADTNAVKSIEGIVQEVLRIYSGEQGKLRNWNAFRDLFIPSARFTIVDHDDYGGPYETATLDEMVALLDDAFFDQAFSTYETGRVVEEYNGIAHVFQSFYLKKKENNERRGINSYQLLHADGRWWIVNMLWTVDSNGVKVPEKYLRN